MWTQTACEALRSGHVLQLDYEGYTRDVEVHAVGFTKDDKPVARVWQVAGGSISNEPVGWKLLRLDEATGAVVTHQRSQAPRGGSWRSHHERHHLSALGHPLTRKTVAKSRSP
jgi:hypothetical protein